MQVNYCAPEYLPSTGLSKLKCILVQTTTPPPPPPRLYTVRYHPYRNPTARDFGYWITAVDWSFLENMENIERQENAFCVVLKRQYKTHFPVKVRRERGTEQPWITPELKRWINKKRRACNCVTMGLYPKLSSEWRRKIKLAKFNYFESVHNESGLGKCTATLIEPKRKPIHLPFFEPRHSPRDGERDQQTLRWTTH